MMFMNVSRLWYSNPRPGYLSHKNARDRKRNLRKKHRGSDLYRKLNVSTVVHHIIEGLLHIGAEVCSVTKYDATRLIQLWNGELRISFLSKIGTEILELGGGAGGSLRVARELESSSGLVSDCSDQVKYPFQPGCFLIMTSRPIKMCSLSYITSGSANCTSGGCTTWIERHLDLIRMA
jgi:hypothetical protein